MANGFKVWEKGWTEDKTYVSSSSYYIYLVAIKESVCGGGRCVCKDDFHFEHVDSKYLWGSDGHAW